MAYHKYAITPPVDIIDLTVESPTNKVVQTHRRLTKNRVSAHRDSVILLPTNSGRNIECENKATVGDEIIDLDNISSAEECTSPVGTYCLHNEADEKLIPLTCSICFENMSSKRKPMSTKCGHVFCTECLQTALHNSKKCPLCKATITQKTCRSLYF